MASYKNVYGLISPLMNPNKSLTQLSALKEHEIHVIEVQLKKTQSFR